MSSRGQRYVQWARWAYRTLKRGPVERRAPRSNVRGDSSCGTCDLGKELGGYVPAAYKPRPILQQWMIDDIYLHSKLMQRIVDLLPRDAFPSDLFGEDAATLSSTRVDASRLQAELDRLKVATSLRRAGSMSRKDGGAALLLFVEDGRRPSQPVDINAVTRVRRIVPLSGAEVKPSRWSMSTAYQWYGETFNEPSMYIISPRTATSQEVYGEWHRSRVVPIPHLDIDRYLAQSNGYDGWGPGVVQMIFQEINNRYEGMERANDTLRSFGYDNLEWPEMDEVLSAKDGDKAMATYLENLKLCRDFTGDGVPVVVTGSGAKINPLSRNVAGFDKLLEAQRVFLLESTPYPEIYLFGHRSHGGLGGNDAIQGEFEQYWKEVGAYRRSYVDGLRQIEYVVQASKLGPTGGVVDPGITHSWPPLGESSEGSAKTRKLNAESRAIDIKSGVVTPAEARADSTVTEAYGQLPDEGEAQDAEEPMPDDIITEADARRRFGFGKKTIRDVAAKAGLRVWGRGGRNRYSLSGLEQALRADSPSNPPRLFSMHRGGDIHGKSGTGWVLDGSVWPDGTVTVRWGTSTASTASFGNYAEFLQVHVDGHEGNQTHIKFHDGEPAPVHEHDPDVVDAVFQTTPRMERLTDGD